MTETVASAEPTPGLFSRAIGVITSPRATFEAVVRSPRWVGMLLTLVLVATAAQVGPTFTERGRNAQLEFQVKQMEKMGMTVTDEMYDRMRQGQESPMAPIFSVIGSLIVIPVFFILVPAGILYAVFNAIMGGTAEFRQVVAVVVHSWVISMLGAVLGGAMNLIRGSVSTSVANLGVMLPMLQEGSFAANLAASVDLFRIWWIIVISIGLSVLYKRKTGNIAVALGIIYALFAVCLSYFFRARG